MKTRHLLAAVSAIALVAAVSVVPGAFGETTKCIGTPVAGTTMLDNVKVPRGQTCTLSNVRVKGSIKVGVDATLVAMNVDVKGSIQGKEFKSVTINGVSKVGGSIQLDDGGFGAPMAVRVNTTRVKGEIQLKESMGVIQITGNRINGDVQLFDNLGASTISTNMIGGNLQCKENLPPPTGTGNLVRGNAEDDCEPLG